MLKKEMGEEGSTPSLAPSPFQETIEEFLNALSLQHPRATPNRKHLARNYSQLLIELLSAVQFCNQELASQVKCKLKKAESIQHLSEVFLEFPQFGEFLERFVLNTPALIEGIYRSASFLPDERVAMLQSYPKFLWGLRHPTEFLSFTDQNKHMKLSRFSELSARVPFLTYPEILREIQLVSRQLLQVQPPVSHHTKHITQLWLNRIKGCLTDQELTGFFQRQIDEYPVREIIDRLKSSRKIQLHTFKAFLAFPEIQTYVREKLIANNNMIREILEDSRMDVKTKLTLVEKYPIFVRAVHDPDSLRNWRTRASTQLLHVKTLDF